MRLSIELSSRYQASLLFCLVELFRRIHSSKFCFHLLDTIFRSLSRFLKFSKFLSKLFFLLFIFGKFKVISLPSDNQIDKFSNSTNFFNLFTIWICNPFISCFKFFNLLRKRLFNVIQLINRGCMHQLNNI